MGRQEIAETLALQVLAWVLADEAETGAFLAATGTDPRDLGRLAQEPEFLGAVLDFLLGDEARLLAFCGANAVAPEAPMRARAALPGGDLPHWT